MSKQARKFRRALHQQYKHELSRYWKLPFVTRLKLAWSILFKVTQEPHA